MIFGQFEFGFRVRYDFGYSDILRNRTKYYSNNLDGVEKPEAKHVGIPGCDTSEILAECGYSTEEIGSLFAAGAALGK